MFKNYSSKKIILFNNLEKHFKKLKKKRLFYVMVFLILCTQDTLDTLHTANKKQTY